MRTTIFLILIFALPAFAKNRKKIAASGPNQVHLVELYSSESCSSCPPADKWVSTLKDRAGLWTDFVPVVFHVDYWNDLGWKDGLSSNLMTERQQDVAATWSEPSVYTPAVVVDGREWRQWSTGALPTQKVKTEIQLSIYQEFSNRFEVVVEGLKDSHDSFTVRIAKLGLGISSSITSGENAGKRLTHNFAVLDWDSKAATAQDPHIHFTLNGKTAPKMAIAAWIEKNGRPVSLQATGGYL